MAVFQCDVNVPSVNDRLTILVIRVRVTGSSCLKIVGIGSNSQDLDLSDIITL